MIALPPELPARPESPAARSAAGLFGWSAGWLGVLALAAFALAVGRAGMDQRSWAALGVAAAPAVAGLLAGRRPAAATALVLAYAVAGGAAAMLTGGLTGPLAFWCLAGLAAAGATGRMRLSAYGGALGLLAAGLSALGAVTIAPPAISGWTDFWLRLLSLGTIAAGLAAGVVLLQRRAAHDARISLAGQVRLERLLNELPFAVLALDRAGKVFANFGQEPPGLDAAGLHGRPLAAACAPDQKAAVEAAIEAAHRDGQAEARLTSAGGAPLWVVLRRVRRGGLIAALLSGAVQAAREAELERAVADADARTQSKSRFLANMSHELRTPLNAIMGFSDIMRARLFGPMADRYVEYAELIHESGAHLLDLINDVLDMSKIEAERFELMREEFDAREAVTAVLRLMRGQADRARVQLRGVLPKEPLMVDADRRAVKQIALNLISNALKFTPAEGQVHVSLQPADGAMQLVVADTGAGIGAEDLERLGRPYEQAGDAQSRSAGTGLGLSLVRAFAELHGGEMLLESQLGHGTTVTVNMPVLLSEAPAPVVTAPEAAATTIH